MKVDLTSSTDVARHALFDPGAIAGESVAPDRMQALVQHGRMFVVDTAADGEIHWRLYVGEAMPAEFQPRVLRETRDILLRAPTGQLHASCFTSGA